MNTPINPRLLVPSGCEATDQGGGHTCDAAECGKNLWLWTGRHWNLNLAMFTARKLSIEASLAVLFEKSAGTSWVVIGLSEGRRTAEAYTVLKNGHVLRCRGLPGRREVVVGVLIDKYMFYSIEERVAALVIKPNRRYKLKVVQAYAPTSSHYDQPVESFNEDVESALSKVKTQYTVQQEDFNDKAKSGSGRIWHRF